MQAGKDIESNNKTTRELLTRFYKLQELDGDHTEQAEALKEEIVRRNIGLVKSIAGDFSPSQDLFDDLTQVGFIGLVNAIYNFDPSRKVNFSTYATHLIKGEIRHYIRDNYSIIKLPRYLQELALELRQVEERFFLAHGRTPTAQELAEKLNMETTPVVEALKTRRSINYISMDWKAGEEDANQPTKIDLSRFEPANSDFPFEYKIRLEIAIERLNKPQRKVIDGLFYQGRTQKEVGEEIGYSQRHVSRLKDQALKKLKRFFLGKKV